MTDAVNFEEFELGDAPEPAQLVRGQYGAKLDSIELGASSEKKTPYMQFHYTVLEVKDVDDEELEEAGGEAELVNKRASSQRFWISEKALWQLKKFVAGAGIDWNGEIKGNSLAKAKEILESKLSGEEFDVFVVRENQTDRQNNVRVDEEGVPITSAVVRSMKTA